MLDVFECRCPSRQDAGGKNDQVTLHDCKSCVYRPAAPAGEVTSLLLTNHMAPGDALVLSAAVRSLHLTYPGRYRVAVDTTAMQLWEHSPDVVLREKLAEGYRTIKAQYPAVDRSDQRAIHFMQAYCEYLGTQLGVPLPLVTNRPHLWLSRAEREWLPQVQEIDRRIKHYWLVNAGTKKDYTSKGWGYDNYQRVVDALRGKVTFVQIGEEGHLHRPLKNVVNLIGKTDTRQLLRLAYHADGVLTGVSFPMHIAAALEKTCVTVAGGREPVAWNSYQKGHLIHSVGTLPCCQNAACWKSRVVPLGDNDRKDNDLCLSPVVGEEPLPRCMALTEPALVSDTILRVGGFFA